MRMPRSFSRATTAARCTRCSPPELSSATQKLSTISFRDLDAIAWPGNDRDMARVFYERQPLGARIAGGMGGGVVNVHGWVHQEFRDLQLEDQI
jgi:hypothetical protein